MPRRPPGSREVMPSKRAMGDRSRPAFGSSHNVSVPISFGLPLLVVGAFLVVTAIGVGGLVLWILGGIFVVAGAMLFASGKRL